MLIGQQVEKVALLPSFYVEDTPRSANEAWARLNNDPLFMVGQNACVHFERCHIAAKEESSSGSFSYLLVSDANC